MYHFVGCTGSIVLVVLVTFHFFVFTDYIQSGSEPEGMSLLIDVGELVLCGAKL